MNQHDMNHAHDELRAIQEFLVGAYFPATKEDLVECAEDNGADSHILAVIRSLPRTHYLRMGQIAEDHRFT